MATDLVQLDTRAQAIYRCGTGVPLRTMMATVHPEDLRALQDLIAAAHRADTPDSRFTVECRMQYPDGEVRWMVVRAQVFFAQVGVDVRTTRVVGTTQEVTANAGRAADPAAKSGMASDSDPPYGILRFGPIGLFLRTIRRSVVQYCESG
jgi:hypothetical protein